MPLSEIKKALLVIIDILILRSTFTTLYDALSIPRRFTPKEIPWYSFLLQAVWTPGLLNTDRLMEVACLVSKVNVNQIFGFEVHNARETG